MKLRNKKTGEGVEIDKIGLVWNKHGMPADIGRYNSLADLNEDWEDYAPQEPLIKDERIRKVVRAWAKANEAFWASTYKSCSDGHYWYIRAFNDTERGIDIDFWGELPKELIDCKCYTIAELCGEEEEC